MQYSMILTAALVAGASANYNVSVSYTTEIVDQYTTYCPGPTQITHAEKTYTVTEATLLTITDCPCTLTRPASSAAPVTSVAPVISSSAAPVISSGAAAVVVSSSVAPVTSVKAVTTLAPAVVASIGPIAPLYANNTAPIIAPAGTAPPSTSASRATPSPPASASVYASASASAHIFKGAANHVAASGFGLAGVLAIAAYLL